MRRWLLATRAGSLSLCFFHFLAWVRSQRSVSAWLLNSVAQIWLNFSLVSSWICHHEDCTRYSFRSLGRRGLWSRPSRDQKRRLWELECQRQGQLSSCADLGSTTARSHPWRKQEHPAQDCDGTESTLFVLRRRYAQSSRVGEISGPA